MPAAALSERPDEFTLEVSAAFRSDMVAPLGRGCSSEVDDGSEADRTPRELSAIRRSQAGQNCSNRREIVAASASEAVAALAASAAFAALLLAYRAASAGHMQALRNG